MNSLYNAHTFLTLIPCGSKLIKEAQRDVVSREPHDRRERYTVGTGRCKRIRKRKSKVYRKIKQKRRDGGTTQERKHGTIEQK